MSTDVQREIGQLLTEQLPAVVDGITEQMWNHFIDMRDQRDRYEEAWTDAGLRIATALLLVDEVLDHSPEECSCDGRSRRCIWHNVEAALRGEQS